MDEFTFTFDEADVEILETIFPKLGNVCLPVKNS
jgi:hypothetical protein